VNKKSHPSVPRIKWPGRLRPQGGSGAANAPRRADTALPEQAPEPSELHTRIVIPRQERTGFDDHCEADIELREVRYGVTTRGAYLRVVPRQRQFVRTAPGYLEATRLASQPVSTFGRYTANVKRALIGSPFATSQAIHERLTKVKALAVFSSDVLSSSAYATEEILIILALAGSGAFQHALPIAGVITLVLAIVVISYRQTIRAYPSGGGSYIVASENLGRGPGLLAAAALMVDYNLTAAVSVAAGVAAITSAMPALYDARVLMGVAVVALMAVGNLRGIRESGTLFAAPTYYFILAFSAMIVVGLIKVAVGDAPGSLLHGAPPREAVAGAQGLTLFLVLRAFASGSVALSGTEAVSNGVPAFKPPESQNARTTMAWMGLILAFLFLGVTFLSSRYGLVPSDRETLVSQLGREILGKNVLYYGYQVATALILLLAANTSFADFPRLSAILAKDGFMPRHYSFKGDRLNFSHGIVDHAVIASVLLIVFQGDVTRLIPLYAIGVFLAFTLSQAGMVRHWWRLREPGWRLSMVINGAGATATAVVTMIIAATKFTHGAWASIMLMAALMLMYILIRRHYRWFDDRIKVDEAKLPVGVPPAVPVEQEGPRDHVIVPVDGINKISLGAIGMARALAPMVTAVHLTDDREEAEQFRERWKKAIPDVPLLLIESPYRAFAAPMFALLESLERSEPDRRITVVLSSFVGSHWWERLLHNRDILRLKPHLRKRPRVRIIDFPYRLQSVTPS
jgi:amino acid transporter